MGVRGVSDGQSRDYRVAREMSISLPNNQRQHRTLHIQKDVLPYGW